MATIKEAIVILNRVESKVDALLAREPATPTPGAPTLTVAGSVVHLSGGRGHDTDWLGVFPAGSDSYLTWVYAPTAVFDWAFGSLPSGQYDVRLLADDGYEVLARVAFTVSGEPGPTPVPDPTPATPGTGEGPGASTKAGGGFWVDGVKYATADEALFHADGTKPVVIEVEPGTYEQSIEISQGTGNIWFNNVTLRSKEPGKMWALKNGTILWKTSGFNRYGAAGGPGFLAIEDAEIHFADINKTGLTNEGAFTLAYANEWQMDIRIKGCIFHHLPNGMLVSSGDHTLTVTDTEVYECGYGDGNGNTHNIYVSQIKSATFDNLYSHGMKANGHLFKCRAGITTIRNSRIFPEAGCRESRAIDISYGGTVVIDNTIIGHSYYGGSDSYQLGDVTNWNDGGYNPEIIGYGLEGPAHGNPARAAAYFTEDSLTISNCKIVNMFGRANSGDRSCIRWADASYPPKSINFNNNEWIDNPNIAWPSELKTGTNKRKNLADYHDAVSGDFRPSVLPSYVPSKVGTWGATPNSIMGKLGSDPINGVQLINDWSNDTYSGCCIDHRNGIIYLALSGGHATDGALPRVIAYNFNDSAKGWYALWNSTTMADLPDYVNDPHAALDYNKDGSPTTSHTYYDVQFSTILHRVMRFGSSAGWLDFGAFRHIDGFDVVARKFDLKGTWPEVHDGYGAEKCREYDRTSDSVVLVDDEHDALYRWDPRRPQQFDTVYRGDGWGGPGYDSMHGIDLVRNWLLVMYHRSEKTNEYEFWVFPLDGSLDTRNAAERFKVELTGPAAHAVVNLQNMTVSIVHVPSRDLYFVWNPATQTMYTIDPKTWYCDVMPTTGFISAKSAGGYPSQTTYNRFGYLPALNCLYDLDSTKQPIQLLRIE